MSSPASHILHCVHAGGVPRHVPVAGSVGGLGRCHPGGQIHARGISRARPPAHTQQPPRTSMMQPGRSTHQALLGVHQACAGRPLAARTVLSEPGAATIGHQLHNSSCPTCMPARSSSAVCHRRTPVAPRLLEAHPRPFWNMRSSLGALGAAWFGANAGRCEPRFGHDFQPF